MYETFDSASSTREAVVASHAIERRVSRTAVDALDDYRSFEPVALRSAAPHWLSPLPSRFVGEIVTTRL